MKSLNTLFCALLVLGVQGFGTHQSLGDNLLNDKEWVFRSNGANEIVEKQISTGPDGAELNIRLTGRDTKIHVWWHQKQKCSEGDIYSVSFEAKGVGEGEHGVDTGVDFFGADNQYLSYKRIAQVCYIDAKWPNATVPDVKEWKAFKGEFTVPPGAGFLGLRLTLGANAPAEAAFRKIVVTKKSN